MTELKFTLEFGECNGYMSVECYADSKLIASPVVVNSHNVIIDTMVEFPFDLTVKVSGKNLNTDTLVQDEKIVKDKYVKIKEIYLARYKVSESVVYNLCKFTPTGHNTEQTNYFYRDGTAVLRFQAADALRWHLSNNKY